jgi:two-component system, OmpR family, alkaline phosphatase synthesis response regulator PhoP
VIRGKHVEPLTPLEMQLLDYLVAAQGRTVDRTQLLRDLWGVDQTVMTRTLDNHVARLRKKIERDAANPQYLITVHGVGYRLAGTTP